MKLLLDVYTSLIFRLSFALPVSFVYRKYSVRVKRKFFWGSASGAGRNVGRVGQVGRVRQVGLQAARAKMWDWWDRWDEWDWWEGCPNKGFNTRRYAYLEVTVRDDF